MAESISISSFGTQLQIGDGGTPENFTTIVEVRDISGPGVQLDTVEVTHHLSPDATREHRPTLKDLTEVTFDIAFVPTEATHGLSTGLLNDWENRTKRNFRLVFTDTGVTTWAFSGYVTGFEITSALEDVYMASVTIKCTGALTEV